MKTKKDIVDNWLPRYTGRELKDFSKYILLTNFEYYLELFSELYQVPIVGADKTMPNVSCNGITLVNFGMGSPNAATILDLLSAIEPEAVLFIGKCGGIKEKNSVGDYILPIAAIKGEGTSDDYLPHEVPALPAFSIQKACSKAITNHGREYYTGVVYTTNRRVWEYDSDFKKYPGHGGRYGNGHDLYCRFCQSYPDRCLTVSLRPSHDLRRNKNSRIGQTRHAEFR